MIVLFNNLQIKYKFLFVLILLYIKKYIQSINIFLKAILIL